MPAYPYDRAAPGTWTSAAWIKKRLQKILPGVTADLISEGGEPAHGRTLLATLRGGAVGRRHRDGIHPSTWVTFGTDDGHECDWDPPCSDLWRLPKAELVIEAARQGYTDLGPRDTRLDLLALLLDHREEIDADREELGEMTKHQLEVFASSLGVTHARGMSKSELIDAVLPGY